jgi:hypothetical protein
MRTPNRKLNDIMERGYVLTWVWKIVFNKLDHGEWCDMEKLKIEMVGWDEEDFLWDEEKENKLRFLEEELRSANYRQIVRMSVKEQEYYVGKEILKNKIKKQWTLDKMRDKFGVGRNAINDTIQETKRELRRRYESRNT